MSDFQTKHYTKAYNTDNPSGEVATPSGIYNNSRQATLMVFPDGSWGDTGFKKYVNRRKVIQKKRTMSSFSMTKELKSALSGDTVDAKLKALEKYSAVYADSVRTILAAQRDRKAAFVYNEFVQGSGLIVFSLILEMFGFKKATGRESENSREPRYAILTSTTTTSADIARIVERFNQPDNMNGDVINVILGSKRIAEGLSFKNVLSVDIQTPWFNYANIEQAIARGIRFGSHNMLIQNGMERPTVDIYQRVANPSNRTPSIDLKMYTWAEEKDRGIKRMEHVLKVSAWDCALNYMRNRRYQEASGSRGCEYDDCEYSCHGVSDALLRKESPQLYTSTFNLYYNTELISKMVDILVNEFSRHFSLSLEYIVSNLFRKESDFDVLSTLNVIEQDNVIIRNRYNIPNYLRHSNNTFFLVDTLENDHTCESRYYSTNPTFTPDTSYEKIVDRLQHQRIAQQLRDIAASRIPTSEFKTIVSQFPVNVQLSLLEAALSSDVQEVIPASSPFRQFVLDHFKTKYQRRSGTDIRITLISDKPRCMTSTFTWRDCTTSSSSSSSRKTSKQEYSKKSQKELETNPYGYYAQINDKGVICIRDVSNIIPDKKHKRTSGKVCTTWKKDDLNIMTIDRLRLDIPANLESRDEKFVDDLNSMSREQLVAAMRKNRYARKYLETEPDMPDREAKRILFWCTIQRNTLCSPYMKEWFQSKDLLVYDEGCGKSSKLKV